MATIKHMAMNLRRGATSQDSLRARRKAAGWSPGYLRACIKRTAY